MIDLLLIVWGVRATVQLAAFMLLILLALRYGAGPEKASALIIGLMPAADALYHMIFQSRPTFENIEIGHFVIDAAVAISLTFIALQANRMYTLWMGAFQLLALEAHLIRTFVDQVSPIAYATMQVAPSYFQIVLLGCGIWMHHRRTGKYGKYRQWRNSSSLSWRDVRQISPAS